MEKDQQSTNTQEYHHLVGTEGISRGCVITQSSSDLDMSSHMAFPMGKPSPDVGKGTHTPIKRMGSLGSCSQHGLGSQNNRPEAAHRAHNLSVREQMKNKIIPDSKYRKKVEWSENICVNTLHGLSLGIFSADN